MMHIRWICQHPTTYNSALFRSLAADPEIDLMVYFVKKMSPSHPWQSDLAYGFKYKFYKRILGLDLSLLRLSIKDKRNFFIIAGWNEPTMISVINLLMLRQRNFAIFTETPKLNLKRYSVKAFIRKIWLQKIFNNASYIMGTGISALSILEIVGCPKHKLVNFPHFIDLNLFKPVAEKNIKKENIIFLSSGRLVNSYKGYDLAIKALGVIKNRMGVNYFKYRIAGDGPDRDFLKSLAKKVGIYDNLEFLGWLEPSQLPDFYRSGHIFLHSAYNERYCVTILEAMASGLVVIGSDATPAILNRIEHMRNGLIHRTGDIDDIVDKIMYVLTHTEKINMMRQSARRTAELWPLTLANDIIKGMLRKKGEI